MMGGATGDKLRFHKPPTPVAVASVAVRPRAAKDAICRSRGDRKPAPASLLMGGTEGKEARRINIGPVVFTMKPVMYDRC